MHCLFVLYLFISNLDLIPNSVYCLSPPNPEMFLLPWKVCFWKEKNFVLFLAFIEPRISQAQISECIQQISECTQLIGECTNSLRSYWTCNFRSYISLPTLQKSNKHILYIMTQSLQSIQYYQRGRYLYAPMQLVNASHRFLLPAWRCFSFLRDTHGNPMHKLEVCPWGHPWSMTVRSQWINLLLIPEKDDSEMSFTNSSEGPDGFEFISQGQHENTFLFWFSLLPSLLLCKPPPGRPILKIQKAFISDSASWEVSLRKT